jgi:2-polyprenyl-3-methyl-5-hydroxy-6-metoxy-1,4-benzoquinol methylase
LKREFDPEDPEWMDRPQPVSRELIRDLQNLAWLNRWFGSYRQVMDYMKRCNLPQEVPLGFPPVRILDLATGYGDIPRLLVSWFRSRGLPCRIDAVDFQSATLEIAGAASAAYPEITYQQGDIRTFESPRRYDFVFCCLALHHLTEEDAVQVLQNCRRLSAGHVFVADLVRNRWVTAGIDLLTATILREPMTRHDARVSARRAFSHHEFGGLARKAGWPQVIHKRSGYARQSIELHPEPASEA